MWSICLRLAAKCYKHANKLVYRYHDDYPYSIQASGIISRDSKNDDAPTAYNSTSDFLKMALLTIPSHIANARLAPEPRDYVHIQQQRYMLYHWYHDVPMPKKHLQNKKDAHLSQFIDTD